MENKYLAVAGIVLALAVGVFFGSKFVSGGGTNINCTNGGATVGGSSPSISTPGSVPGLPTQEVRFGATSGTSYSSFPGSLAAATTTIGTQAFYVGSDISKVGVNTSTNLTANETLVSGSQTVSSTLQLGSSYEGATRRGVMCFWNGTNFTKFWIDGTGAGVAGGFSTSSASTCP